MSIIVRYNNGCEQEYEDLREALHDEYSDALLSHFTDKDCGNVEFNIYQCQNLRFPYAKKKVSLAEARGLLLAALTKQTTIGESDSDMFYAFCCKEGNPISVPKRLQKKYPSIY